MTKHTPTKRNLAVITGADGGMGREITLAVAAKGYTVVMVCQNEEKAEPKRREIVACTGNKSVEIMTADFCSLASVGRLADRLLQRNEPIDLLMNNAGTLDPRHIETVDGWPVLQASTMSLRTCLPASCSLLCTAVAAS